MQIRLPLALTATFCLVAFAFAFAQARPDTLENRLSLVRESLALQNGKIIGIGAKTLEESVRNAGYVLIGEDHGIAQIPEFCSALFDWLAPQGFKTVVVEAGPVAIGNLRAFLNGKNPTADVAQFAADYPFSLAFFDMKPELEFLQHARQAAGPNFRLVGVDQELMGSGKLLLQGVLDHRRKLSGKEDDIQIAVRQLLEEDKADYAEAVRTGNPNAMFMMTAEASKLETLRKTLVAAKDSADIARIDALLESRAIYESVVAAQNESNQRRAILMKRSFINQIAGRAGEIPKKIFFKFGSNHVMKGLDFANSRELGNSIAEFADSKGAKSVHILVVAVKGQQLRFAGVGKPYQPTPVDMIGNGGSDLPFAKPVFELALQTGGEWSLFDFRKLRDFADKTKNLDPKVVRMIFGYDLAIIIPEAQPSTQIR